MGCLVGLAPVLRLDRRRGLLEELVGGEVLHGSLHGRVLQRLHPGPSLRRVVPGGLLLLLLLLGTVIGGLLCGGFCGCFLSWWGCFLLLFTAAGNKESDHILGSNETIIVDLEFAKDVIDLGLVELVTEVHESMAEHLSLDFALDLVCLEGTDDEVIGVVGATS